MKYFKGVDEYLYNLMQVHKASTVHTVPMVSLASMANQVITESLVYLANEEMLEWLADMDLKATRADAGDPALKASQ